MRVFPVGNDEFSPRLNMERVAFVIDFVVGDLKANFRISGFKSRMEINFKIYGKTPWAL